MSENNTIIIGAGAAGLSVSACLKRAGVSSIILEQSNTVGVTWRKHYDRLHLHTDKRNSGLPYLPMPVEYPRYPSRDQVASYIESYAKQFELDVRFNQQVKSVRQENGLWHIQTQDTLHSAPNLVVATGYARQPLMPEWPGLKTFPGNIVHSSQYKNGSAFKDQSVLVVGFGNSGGEIAVDLHEHGAKSAIAVRSAVNVIPRELAGIPILSIGIVQNKMPMWLADAINAPILRMVIGDITKYGLRKLPYGPATQIAQDKRIPLIDVGTMKLIRGRHIQVYSGVKDVSGNQIKFEDGNEAEFDSLILATGYRPQVSEFMQGIPSVFDEEGTPLSTGTESSMRGLYFCGYYVSPTGMLREIAIEARQIAQEIATR